MNDMMKMLLIHKEMKRLYALHMERFLRARGVMPESLVEQSYGSRKAFPKVMRDSAVGYVFRGVGNPFSEGVRVETFDQAPYDPHTHTFDNKRAIFGGWLRFETLPEFDYVVQHNHWVVGKDLYQQSGIYKAENLHRLLIQHWKGLESHDWVTPSDCKMPDPNFVSEQYSAFGGLEEAPLITMPKHRTQYVYLPHALLEHATVAMSNKEVVEGVVDFDPDQIPAFA